MPPRRRKLWLQECSHTWRHLRRPSRSLALLPRLQLLLLILRQTALPTHQPHVTHLKPKDRRNIRLQRPPRLGIRHPNNSRRPPLRLWHPRHLFQKKRRQQPPKQWLPTAQSTATILQQPGSPLGSGLPPPSPGPGRLHPRPRRCMAPSHPRRRTQKHRDRQTVLIDLLLRRKASQSLPARTAPSNQRKRQWELIRPKESLHGRRQSRK